MQIIITGKNVKITKALRDFVNKKVTKVIDDFEHPIDCEVILSVEKNNRHIAELILSGDSNKFYFKKESSDLYASIEEVIRSADLKIKKFKEKQKDRKRKNKKIEKSTKNRQSKSRISIKTEDINSIKPMSLEEAILEIKFLNSSFIIFRNFKNFHTYILYKKENSDYYNVILPRISWLNKIFKKGVENSYINMSISYKNGKAKIVKKEKINVPQMDTSEAIKYILDNKLRFYIFIDENDELVLLYMIKKNQFGRYFLNA